MNKTAYRLISFAVAIALAFGASSQVLASTPFDPGTQGQPSALLAARTFYVSTTGSDSNSGSSTAPFKTFAKALSMLAPGDTLQVKPGTYYEAVVLSRSGTASAPITVIGNGAVLDARSSRNTGLKISGSYLNVSNFEITGAVDAGIGIPGKNITVSNNKVHDNVTQNGIGTCGQAGSWSSAVKVGVGGENIIIENNTVYRNCGEGIAVTRGVNVTVRNNTVYDNSAPNIYVDNSPFTTVQGNLVYCTGAVLRLDGRRPTAIGLGEEYYAGWGAQLHDVTIIGNTIRDCGKGIGAFQSEVNGTLTNVTITRNNIPSGQGRAIYIHTLSNRNVMVSYNTIFNAVQLEQPAGITLLGNIITGNGAPPPTNVSSPTSPPASQPTPTRTSTLPPVSNTATSTPVVSNTATPLPTFTSTPLALPSATPTSPPAATFTSTPAPSATAAQQGPDPIFGSGFESGNFSGWTSNENGGGDLSVSPSAALVGSNGLQAVINDDSTMYVTDDTPNAEAHYRARFYFDPNSIAMTNGDYMYILQGYTTSRSASILRIEFKYNNGTYQVRARTLDNGGAWKNTTQVTMTDAPHVLEVDWVAASAPGANNGSLTFWVDGTQQGNLTGLANDTYRMDRVRLGVPYLSIDSTTGTLYFDAFESRRQTYIGP
jgi:parallel beta-helix repeat protein